MVRRWSTVPIFLSYTYPPGIKTVGASVGCTRLLAQGVQVFGPRLVLRAAAEHRPQAAEQPPLLVSCHLGAERRHLAVLGVLRREDRSVTTPTRISPPAVPNPACRESVSFSTMG